MSSEDDNAPKDVHYAKNILKDIANYYMRDESNPSSEFWDITPYNDPKQKAEIKFDINARKRVYVTFECCGSRVPHIVVFAPTTYLAYLRLARVIIDTTRAHCEIQIKKQKGLEDVAQLDSDNENSLKSHQNFRDRFAEDNEKVGRYYPYDLLDEMCQMLFQNSQPHLEYPIGKTKLYATFDHEKSPPYHDCENCNRKRLKVKIDGSINMAYKQLLRLLMRILEDARKCEETEKPQSDLYDRKGLGWRKRISLLPEIDELPATESK